ncbi:hypothetical protein CSW98_12290 [Vibrio sp. HA2012]|uniref:LPP20 family lipoprotein n=1 Tax=Vibrio sp. HA2012 TaxID=1971595 RepID=UPI000C2BE8E6|nr:LPP20 family lipoprotein [Vibrio sp. HA2012]PJC85832.1 hypothetical protein CSW98_12290 [Vibrio sp. HA2012]
MKKLLLVGVAVAALAGCQSDSTVKGVQNYTQCTFPDAPTTEAPAWICDVMPDDLAIGARGYAKKSAAGQNVMRRIAMNDARVALASEFETNVSNMFQQALTGTSLTSSEAASEDVMEAFRDVTKSVTNRTLANSRVIVSQVSPTGGLYVLIGMDKPAYESNLDKVVDAANSEDSELRKQFNNQKTESVLTSVLESMKTK